jgi:hypothetical protein
VSAVPLGGDPVSGVPVNERPRYEVGAVLVGFVLIELANEVILLTGAGNTATAAALIPVTLVLLAAIVASMPGPRPLDLSSSLVILIAAMANMLLVTPQATVGASTYFSTRHLWASGILLLMLALRGRLLWAWLGMAGVFLLQVGWAMNQPASGFWRLDLSLGAAGLLLIGTLFFAGIARTTRRANTAWRAQRTAMAEQAAIAAVTEARLAHTKRLIGIAGPLLERISEGQPLSAEERLECLLVEGSLRDAARAPGLADAVMTAVVREARRRGVQVTLFDDRHGQLLTPMERNAVTGWMIDKLAPLKGGSFTARLLPADRGPLATVVITDDDGMRALEYAGSESA